MPGPESDLDGDGLRGLHDRHLLGAGGALRCRLENFLELFLSFLLLAEVDLHVSAAFVAAGESAAAHFAGERLLAGMGANVSCKMIRSREVSHTDSTLEGLLSGVSSHVTGQLIRSREATWTVVDGARVRTFTRGHLRLLRGVVSFLLENTEPSTVDRSRVDRLERVRASDGA